MNSNLANLLFFVLIAGAIAMFVIAKTHRPTAVVASAPVIQCPSLSPEVQSYIDSKFAATKAVGATGNAIVDNRIIELEKKVAELTETLNDHAARLVHEKLDAQREAATKARASHRKKDRDEEFKIIMAMTVDACKPKANASKPVSEEHAPIVNPDAAPSPAPAPTPTPEATGSAD